MDADLSVTFVFGSFSLGDDRGRGWCGGGDASFTDEDSEAPRGDGAQMGPFTGQYRTFSSLVCLCPAWHMLFPKAIQKQNVSETGLKGPQVALGVLGSGWGGNQIVPLRSGERREISPKNPRDSA